MRPEATEVKANHLETYQKLQLFQLLLTAQWVQKFTNSLSAINQSTMAAPATPPETPSTKASDIQLNPNQTKKKREDIFSL